MSAKTNNTEKLAELLKDYSVEELRSIFNLLQEDHNGTVRPFTETQVDAMDKVLPFANESFSQETIATVVEQLKKTKSKMSKLGRTQVSRFILSLSRDEIVEVVELLIPFFVKHSGKFISTLTVDQKLATFDVLFSEILKNAENEKEKIAEVLLGLYTVGRIGESLEILNNAEEAAAK
jgi:hypothetical protein